MDESLSRRQIAFVLFGAAAGFGVQQLPKVLAEYVGTGTWIAILITTTMAIIAVYINTKLACVHEGMTIYHYSKTLVGNPGKYIILIIYIPYYVALSTFVSRYAGEIIKAHLLIKTPAWAIVLLFLIFSYYAVSKKLKVISMLSEFFGALIFITVMFL